MSEPLTLQTLIDASLDAKTLENFVNGSDSEDANPRLNTSYPTIKKAVKELFENGGIAGRFKTLVELQSSLLTDGDFAIVANDTQNNNGIYIKQGGTWSLASYNPLNDARDYLSRVAEKIELIDNSVFLEAHQDKDGEIYEYTDIDGKKYLIGLNKSVQDSLSDLSSLPSASAMKYTEKPSLLTLTDSADGVYASFDSDGNLVIPNDISVGEVSRNNSLSYAINRVNKTSNRLSVLSLRPKIKNITSVSAYTSLDPTHKRMPFAVRTSYGFLLMHHKQIQGYNGDSKGSEIWKAIIDMDSDYNLSVRSHELFMSPVNPWGVVKHPTFSRTNDGRIMLVYEVGGETASEADPLKYTQYIRYSSNEGVTFSAESPLSITNKGDVTKTNNTVLGTTGSAIKIGSHHILSMYSVPNNRCYTLHSYDDGVTWSEGAYVEGNKGSEPQITKLDDRLLMTVRGSETIDKWYAYSFDEGLTWEYQGLMSLRAPSNQAAVFYDESIGAVIHAHNNVSTGLERKKYSLSLSFDGGRSYEYTYQPYADNWFAGYSQIIKVNEGVYAIILEYSDDMISGFNSKEGTGVIIISLSEVLNNVSFN